MIKVFYGENRVAISEAVRKFLGEDYEVVEGTELAAEDLPSLMKGNSLFETERRILVRDILANKAACEDLPKYVDTPHKMVFWEMKVDKRAGVYKDLEGEVEFREFAMPRDKNAGLVFDIYRTAKRDGVRAVAMLDKIKDEQEPIMFLGLMVSQAVRDFAVRPGMKEKRALLELSKLDMDLKSAKLQPWLLISSFLLRLSSL
ncbi:hypothetical protein IKF89_01370 [Candidatus Saccharibacteria bacterium]|nr:hypothetical protein [Candidatus Saccharibacteria bacterium]